MAELGPFEHKFESISKFELKIFENLEPFENLESFKNEAKRFKHSFGSIRAILAELEPIENLLYNNGCTNVSQGLGCGILGKGKSQESTRSFCDFLTGSFHDTYYTLGKGKGYFLYNSLSISLRDRSHKRFKPSFSSIRAKTAELEPVKDLRKNWPFKGQFKGYYSVNNGVSQGYNSLFFVFDERVYLIPTKQV